MKERYIQRVRAALSAPRSVKREIVRDLEEAFASAAEHGETEQQVIRRLGVPEEFAASAAESFGVGQGDARRRTGLRSALLAAVVAVAAFSLYAAARPGGVPEGAIGQADAATQIQVTGGWGGDLLYGILAVGVAAALLAVFQVVRAVRKAGNPR